MGKSSTILIVAALICAGISAHAGKSDAIEYNASRIKPYSNNPRYWQYKGEPVLLLGGSKDDSLFQIPDLKEHLDLLASVGGNCIRNTMSSRQDKGFEVYRFKRLPSGKYDLNRWNSEYWERFSRCLKWCSERDIIIQIELWDRFDYSQEHWKLSPWHPDNNVNYTNEQTGLADNYPAHPSQDRQPFFHTIPGMQRYKKRYDRVRRFQEKFVEKMLSYTLDYGNVLYCMSNETSTPPAWGRYWMKFISDKAAKSGLKVCVTDMFDDAFKPESSAKLRQAFDDPEAYTFLDISQVNSRTFNEAQWVKLMWLDKQAQKHPRPLNNTKIYSDGSTGWGSGTPIDGIERFWRHLIAGSASCRFHRPTAGIGLNETAQACIRAARKIESNVKFWFVTARMDLLGECQPDEAYLAAKDGEQYILYFTDGGSIALDLTGHDRKFNLSWVNISTGNFAGNATLTGGGKVAIRAPGKGGWVAAIVKGQKRR